MICFEGGSTGKIALAKGGRSFGELFPIIQLVRNVGQQPLCTDHSDPGKRERGFRFVCRVSSKKKRK